jgi:hypothetical protein
VMGAEGGEGAEALDEIAECAEPDDEDAGHGGGLLRPVSAVKAAGSRGGERRLSLRGRET